MRKLMGVDLGKRQDYSAAITIERGLVEQDRDGLPESWAHQQQKIIAAARYDVIDIKRWDLGTDYLDVIPAVRKALWHPQLLHKTTLVVDATGVGEAVIEVMERLKMDPNGVMLTAGTSSRLDADTGLYHVAKQTLVTKIQLAFQGGRIKINPELELAGALEEELRKFTLKTTQARNDTYEAFSEKDHDDMVIALAIAIWFAESEWGTEVVVGAGRHGKQDYDPLRSTSKDTLRN